MISKTLMIAIFVAIASALAALTPERKVAGNVITSERDPAVRIELPKAAQYTGADRFVLYEVADCELHAFIEADHERKVERLYWVQFEGYLPSKPELHYSYDSPRHVMIGGLDFYVDTEIASHETKRTPGSDGEHIRWLVQARRYQLPAERISVRFVHLFDDKRKELMIVYSEDLTPIDLSAADLREGGNAFARWPALKSELIERAKSKITITTPDKL